MAFGIAGDIEEKRRECARKFRIAEPGSCLQLIKARGKMMLDFVPFFFFHLFLVRSCRPLGVKGGQHRIEEGDSFFGQQVEPVDVACGRMGGKPGIEPRALFPQEFASFGANGVFADFVARGVGIGVHLDAHRGMPAAAIDHGFARLQERQEVFLFVGKAHGIADGVAIIRGKEAVHDLGVGVFDDVGNELVGNLVGDDEPFVVFAHFGQEVGEGFHALFLGVGFARFGACKEPVRFFDEGEVAEVFIARVAVLDGFRKALEDEGHEQRFVLLILDLVELDHDVFVEQLVEVERTAGVDHAPFGAHGEILEAGHEGAAVFFFEFLAHAGRSDHPVEFGDHFGKGGPRLGIGCPGILVEEVFSAVNVPAFVFVGIDDGLGNDVGHRGFHRENGGERRLEEVDVAGQVFLRGHQFERVEAKGREVFTPEHIGLQIGAEGMQGAVFRLGGFDDEEGKTGVDQEFHAGGGFARAGDATDEHMLVEVVLDQADLFVFERPSVLDDVAELDHGVVAQAVGRRVEGKFDAFADLETGQFFRRQTGDQGEFARREPRGLPYGSLGWVVGDALRQLVDQTRVRGNAQGVQAQRGQRRRDLLHAQGRERGLISLENRQDAAF